jgi:hypothetical protein
MSGAASASSRRIYRSSVLSTNTVKDDPGASVVTGNIRMPTLF